MTWAREMINSPSSFKRGVGFDLFWLEKFKETPLGPLYTIAPMTLLFKLIMWFVVSLKGKLIW